MSPTHVPVLRHLSCTGPMCCPKDEHVPTLVDKATDSNTPIQLVCGHLRTNPVKFLSKCGTAWTFYLLEPCGLMSVVEYAHLVSWPSVVIGYTRVVLFCCVLPCLLFLGCV